MRVLVTGATGFIGSALCSELCRDGYEVAAFHRRTSYMDNIQDLSIVRTIGDLTDEDSVDQAVGSFRPEVIFHLGAQMVPAPTVNRIMQVNVLGTRAVFLAALKYGVSRVVMMSSACTLGMPELFRKHNQQPGIINESRVQNTEEPLWPFARSKYLAEMEAQSAATGGLDTVIVNPFLVVGPGDRYRRKSSILMQLKNNPPSVAVRGGINVIPVEDVVRGLRHACRYGRSGERYLLCGENLTFMEFCRICSRAGGFEEPKLLFEEDRLAGPLIRAGIGRSLNLECLGENILHYTNRFFFYDPKKSRVELHLPAAGDVRDTIERTYRWFEENA